MEDKKFFDMIDAGELTVRQKIEDLKDRRFNRRMRKENLQFEREKWLNQKEYSKRSGPRFRSLGVNWKIIGIVLAIVVGIVLFLVNKGLVLGAGVAFIVLAMMYFIGTKDKLSLKKKTGVISLLSLVGVLVISGVVVNGGFTFLKGEIDVNVGSNISTRPYGVKYIDPTVYNYEREYYDWVKKERDIKYFDYGYSATRFAPYGLADGTDWFGYSSYLGKSFRFDGDGVYDGLPDCTSVVYGDPIPCDSIGINTAQYEYKAYTIPKITKDGQDYSFEYFVTHFKQQLRIEFSSDDERLELYDYSKSAVLIDDRTYTETVGFFIAPDVLAYNDDAHQNLGGCPLKVRVVFRLDISQWTLSGEDYDYQYNCFMNGRLNSYNLDFTGFNYEMATKVRLGNTVGSLELYPSCKDALLGTSPVAAKTVVTLTDVFYDEVYVAFDVDYVAGADYGEHWTGASMYSKDGYVLWKKSSGSILLNVQFTVALSGANLIVTDESQRTNVNPYTDYEGDEYDGSFSLLNWLKNTFINLWYNPVLRYICFALLGLVVLVVILAAVIGIREGSSKGKNTSKGSSSAGGSGVMIINIAGDYAGKALKGLTETTEKATKQVKKKSLGFFRWLLGGKGKRKR